MSLLTAKKVAKVGYKVAVVDARCLGDARESLPHGKTLKKSRKRLICSVIGKEPAVHGLHGSHGVQSTLLTAACSPCATSRGRALRTAMLSSAELTANTHVASQFARHRDSVPPRKVCLESLCTA